MPGPRPAGLRPLRRARRVRRLAGAEAAFVAALVAALDVRVPLNLVGHDFGGHFGLA
ncbi:MAG: hypothetical protein M3Q65_22230 [Chloroflexota bacterium]|nr:hypothetical protein [Chloroflexota bacterium]